jgi:hypothetical protein
VNPIFCSILFSVALLLGTLAMLEAGRCIGTWQRAKDPEGASVGYGAVEGAIFGLMGLLIAFTFSGAATRFDVRRQMIVEEANCIGTAYLGIDLLPLDAHPTLRELLRRYLDSRLKTFQALSDTAALNTQLALTLALWPSWCSLSTLFSTWNIRARGWSGLKRSTRCWPKCSSR